MIPWIKLYVAHSFALYRCHVISRRIPCQLGKLTSFAYLDFSHKNLLVGTSSSNNFHWSMITTWKVNIPLNFKQYYTFTPIIFTYCNHTTKKPSYTDGFSCGCFNNSHYMESVLTVSDNEFVVTPFLGQPQMPNNIVTVSFDSQNSVK